MPGALDSCINNIYEDGNIGASAGEEPVRVVIGTLLDPDDYDPDTDVTEYSLNYSRFYNSGYLLLLMV
jgi:hypothetical protein